MTARARRALLAIALSAAMTGACAERSAPDARPEPRPTEPGPKPATAVPSTQESPSQCPATPWASYGHDPARTSASDGCIEGPITQTWKLGQQPPCGYRFRAGRFLNVVAEENAIFVGVDCGGSPAVIRVSPAGQPMWTFSRGDYGRGTWPALAGSAIVSTDDGVFLVDRDTGKYHGRELDVWGEPIVVGDAYYVDNTFQLDGAGPFVGAFDGSLKWKWKASVISPGKGKAVARTGGIAYADGLVVHSAAMGARSVPSLAAHDAATGDKRWLASGTWPETAPSIAEGRVFVVERWQRENGDRLVARSLADGSVQWSTTTPWARGPAPVIAEKLVILHGREGVNAYDRATGTLAWSNPTPRKAAFEEAATTMAVAKGSRTLVVTSGARVVVLKLDDGTEQWSGVVATGSSPTAPGGVTVERPVIVGRTLYVTSDGSLLRLAAK
jgi:outer membrane protein assembly factor BamB